MKHGRLLAHLLHDVIDRWRCAISVQRMCLLRPAGSQAVLFGCLSSVETNILS